MRRLPLILFVLLSAAALAPAPAAAQSGPQQTVTLNDGTVLRGQLLDVDNGNYLIRTDALGEVWVKGQDVLSITQGGLAQGGAMPPAGAMPQVFSGGQPGPMMPGMDQGQLQQIQQKMLSDPQVMESIQQLMQDPQMMNLMTDNGLMNDLFSMDPQRIKANPAIQQLMDDPAIQEIIERVQQQFGTQPGGGFMPGPPQ